MSYMGDYEMDGGIRSPGVLGPLIGGGVTQGTSMAARALFKSRPAVVKWSGLIGLAVGGGISGILAAREGTRDMGISGLVTAAVVAVPKIIEDLFADDADKAGYLGIITPEREMNGYLGEGEYDDGMMGLGAEQDIQLLDASPGTMGIITPEREMNGAGPMSPMGAGGGVSDDVELMGGFGSNFLSQQ